MADLRDRMVLLIVFSLDYARYVIVQWIEIWWARGHVSLEDMILEIGTHSRFGNLHRMRRCVVLLDDVKFTYSVFTRNHNFLFDFCADRDIYF